MSESKDLVNPLHESDTLTNNQEATENKELTVDEAHEIQHEIRVYIQQSLLCFLEIGARLIRIKQGNGWRSLGHDSFDAWLADPQGINIQRRSAYNFMRLYKLWLNKIKRNFPHTELLNIGYSKLLLVANELEKTDDPEKIKNILHDARSMSRSDLHKYLQHKKVVFSGKGKLQEITERPEGKLVKISTIKQYYFDSDTQVIWDELVKKSGWVRFRIEPIEEWEMDKEQ